MSKLVKAYATSSYYWVPRIILIMLCALHEKTKYHTARNIRELFYWPDGYCLDMLVLAVFGVIMAICIWRDCKILSLFFMMKLDEED